MWVYAYLRAKVSLERCRENPSLFYDGAIDDICRDLAVARRMKKYGSYSGYISAVMKRVSRNCYLFPSEAMCLFEKLSGRVCAPNHYRVRKGSYDCESSVFGMINGECAVEHGMFKDFSSRQKFVKFVKRESKKGEDGRTRVCLEILNMTVRNINETDRNVW